MKRTIDWRELAAIFAGGAAGALLRVWIGTEFGGAGTGWPWATFAVNISGALVLGYVVTRLPRSRYGRRLLGTGFCGAYTTFSTMQVELLKMLDRHSYGLAAGYAAASIAAGLCAVWLTSAAVRRTGVIV